MEKTVRCPSCRQDFVPDTEYEFPNCFAYWHNCVMGAMTQVIVKKEKKQFWLENKEIAETSHNKTLDMFYDPWNWYRKFHKKHFDEEY